MKSPNVTPAKVAARIVEGILDDLKGRSGLGDVFDSCDPDIQKEIVAGWKKIAQDVLSGKK